MPKSIGAIGRGGFGWLWLAFGHIDQKPTKTNQNQPKPTIPLVC